MNGDTSFIAPDRGTYIGGPHIASGEGDTPQIGTIFSGAHNIQSAAGIIDAVEVFGKRIPSAIKSVIPVGNYN